MTIENSYVWDGATIGDNCEIRGVGFFISRLTPPMHCQAFLGEGVVLYRGVRVDEHCLLGQGVQLGPDLHVPTFTNFSLRPPAAHTDDDDADEEVEAEQHGDAGMEQAPLLHLTTSRVLRGRCWR